MYTYTPSPFTYTAQIYSTHVRQATYLLQSREVDNRKAEESGLNMCTQLQLEAVQSNRSAGNPIARNQSASAVICDVITAKECDVRTVQKPREDTIKEMHVNCFLYSVYPYLQRQTEKRITKSDVVLHQLFELTHRIQGLSQPSGQRLVLLLPRHHHLLQRLPLGPILPCLKEGIRVCRASRAISSCFLRAPWRSCVRWLTSPSSCSWVVSCSARETESSGRTSFSAVSLSSEISPRAAERFSSVSASAACSSSTLPLSTWSCCCCCSEEADEAPLLSASCFCAALS
ncbi:hypothetical protein EYF80_018439 [Liparis tanakae]|uniref:Uncharacterized protein n=1 Tax=Liparis tanakae TaxID=230148 RepID=A0A4Z2I0M6_9TELE|nr:hypothetical protein EYF80_018439 [Liparis tanakae]